jgi:hypothetical protein
MAAKQGARCVTLSRMNEKRVSPEMKQAPDRAAREKEKPQNDPKRETRKRIREIAERHRETLDYLARR